MRTILLLVVAALMALAGLAATFCGVMAFVQALRGNP